MIYVLSGLIIILNCWIIYLLLKNKKQEKNKISDEELLKIRESVIASLDVITKSISTNIEMQNKLFMEQINNKIEEMNKNITSLNNSNNDFQIKLINSNNESFTKINEVIQKNNNENINNINNAFKDINKLINDNNEKSIKDISSRLEEFSKIIKEKMNDIDKSVTSNLENIRKDNDDKLEKIRGTVDEKLQKTLEERLNNSFKNVIEQIGGVNKAIGEIKGLAGDVSSLKNVLANVKTKGIVGEVILGNLIREILTSGQYEENVVTKEGSKDPVEFAIKMPGEKDGETVYMPVDSKFPTESYSKILEAIEQADKDGIEASRKELKTNIKKFAKDISTKYIDEPNTTGFAIMFLPIEGLYAEVINMGLFEELQREYKICVCGPSTFSALLNALQMGFKSLVIQKKSAEVFKLLGAIKTEFNTFAEALEKTQSKVDQAGKELSNLVGTRTRAMQRKLRDIEEIPEIESKEILEISKGE